MNKQRLFVLLAACAFIVCPEVTARAGDPAHEKATFLHKFGMSISAPNGPSGRMVGIVPIPMAWPEQEVKLVKEEKDARVRRIRYRTLSGGVRQMLIEVPRLRKGETAAASVILQITRSVLPPPKNTEQFRLPSRTDRSLRLYLAAGPKIESGHQEIKAKAKEVYDAALPPWGRVKKIYDWVFAHKAGRQKGAVNEDALTAPRNGCGDCGEHTVLFVALCRANGIPARMVWIPSHAYPEFHLLDENGKGRWFGCQSLGEKTFGFVRGQNMILQKGDNIKMPEHREPLFFARPTVAGSFTRGGAQPTFRVIDERIKSSGK